MKRPTDRLARGTRATRASGPVDWAALRARLARSVLATELALHPEPERARALLDARAKRLARPLELPGEAPREALELLVFTLGRERYGVPAAWVREVLRLADCVRVPGVPPHFLGVTHHRGEVVAVVDVGVLFGTRREGLSDRAKLVVLGAPRAEVGLVADTLAGVERFAGAALRPAMEDGARGSVQAVGSDGTVVLDVEALLRDPRMTLDQRDTWASPPGEEGR